MGLQRANIPAPETRGHSLCTYVVAACAQVSTILGAVIPAQRAEQAWTEGVAIWVAVVVVSFVGAPTRPHSWAQQLGSWGACLAGWRRPRAAAGWTGMFYAVCECPCALPVNPRSSAYAGARQTLIHILPC